jgi:hypothetical protein
MEARDEMSMTEGNVQVVAKPRRRVFTAEYKRQILKAADACATPGAVGALLRREGLYSSHLVARMSGTSASSSSPRAPAHMRLPCRAARTRRSSSTPTPGM